MIDILCPTRGRPDQFKRMVESAEDTAYGGVNILAYVDSDDASDYPGWVVRGKPLPLGPAYQHLYERSVSSIVMMAADDIVFRTKSWDKAIHDIAPTDGVFVISYDDLGRPKKEDGHPFIGRKFIEAVGYLTYPKLSHSCVDNWAVDIAKGAGRFFYSDVVIEHLHPKYRKGEWDQTYLDNSKAVKQADGAIYLGPEGKAEISAAIKRVKAYLENDY